jgi:hypothetical protein
LDNFAFLWSVVALDLDEHIHRPELVGGFDLHPLERHAGNVNELRHNPAEVDDELIGRSPLQFLDALLDLGRTRPLSDVS